MPYLIVFLKWVLKHTSCAIQQHAQAGVLPEASSELPNQLLNQVLLVRGTSLDHHSQT
jgi:hypothetical protein